MELLWVFFVLFQYSEGTNLNGFEISDAEIIRDDRLPENEIFGEPLARPDYAPMYDYRFFSSEEYNYRDFLLGPLLKVSQKSADVAYNQEIPCRKASRPLTSGALICFADEPIHAGLIGKFADRGDSFCQSHGYDYMVDSINSADFVSLAQLHKEMLTADPQFPPEVTINAIRSSSTEMRWCEGNCEIMDFTVSSNLVSTGSTPTNFAEVFDPQSNQFNLVVISNGGPNPIVQMAKNITPACITKPRDQSDPLMKVYPLVFEYHANDSVVPLNPNTALPDASMTLKNYALIGSKYAPQFAPKTQHEVTLQRLKNFKRTQLSFFHLCGTKNATASPEGYCKIDVSLKGPNFDDVFKPVANFSDSELKNDGTLMTSSPWQRKRVQIPRLHQQDYKMRIRGEFDWKNGGIGLDSIRLSTMQRCHPRWFRVHETQFITSTSFLFQDGLDNYELGGVSETLLRTKHQRETVLNNQTTLEECSRLCWLGSGCDIFEYDSALKSCRFHPHTTLKQELWSKFAQHTSQPTTALYVLECSESQENILIESDPEYHRSDLWNVDIECGELFLTQSQWNDKAAVFGGKQRLVGMDCGANQKLEIKGNLKMVSQLPMTINQAYLDAAKPGAMATVYFRSSEASEVDISVGTAAKTVTLAKNESMGVTLYTANFDTHYSADDEILVKATAGGAGSKIYMTRIDMALDLPIRIGCFGDPANVLDVSGSIADPGQSPALCLTTCLQAGKRFAFLKGGDQCLCFDEISQSLIPEPQQSCNLPCSGDGQDFCGGSNSMSVFVATCPTSMVRFGDYCYFPSDTNDHSITKNERLCTETDDSAHLWYPESEEELAFVKEKFPSSSYHIGYRQSHPNYGFQHSDYSMGFGLPFFTSDRSGLPAFEEEADLFRTKCVIWESGNNNKFTLKSPCEDSKGICRRKLAQGYGYKLIGSYLKYQSMTSLKVKDATPVSGLGPFHFELDMDYYVKERYIEMMLPEPVVMSGLMVETDNTRYLQEFTLQYLEMASLFPERLRNVEITHKSPVIFRVIEDSLTEEPPIISRKIMLPYPIETKHFRMVVRKGGPQIAVRLDIIGQLVSERYQLNPFLDRRQLQFDIPNLVLIQKSSYGLTKFNLNPGGAITIRLVLPTHQKTPENDVNVVIVSRIFLVDSKGKATKFTLRIPKADMRLNILIENEIGLTFSEELRGPFPNNPTYNSPVEIRVEFQTNGFKLFVNGMQIKLFKDMVVNNVVPKLTRITWGTSVFGAQISRVTIETDNEFGLSYDYGRTLFNTQQTEETKVDLAPYKDNVILKDESTLLQMFYRAYSFKPNEYDFGYIPFQFIQQCYHSYNGNAKCFPAKGIFNSEKNVNYGYGGGTLASEILRCPSGYEYFGHVCVNFPVRNPESYTAASSKCAPKGDMVYYSPNKLQNTLFRQAMMFLYKNEPSHTIWVGVRQISGEWIASNGRIVTEQFSDWAPNEPNLANGDCAVADKLLGYKWRTTNCAEPHASMCALKVPNCPPGYIYETKLSDAPQYGSRSCYKITKLGSFIDGARAKRVSSVSVADSICLRDHTRLFAPRNAFQADMIHDWLSKHTIWDKDTNATHKVSFFTGVRSFSNTTIIAANDFEPSKTLNSSSLGSNCFRIDYEWGYSMIETPCDQESDLPIDYDNREFFGICQYKECRTTVNSTCSFPFRFNGRLYDTCVSLGPDSTPWCSTGVDDNLNHIPGYEKFCDSTCHVDNCPLGFYRNYMDRTCYQVSSKFPRDGALSFDDALMKCQTQGARLWEPRTTSAFSNILKTDMAIPHFAWMANAATATGLRAKVVGGSVTVVYQGSDVPMSEDLKSALIWETGYPVASPPCIGLVNGKLKNVDCDGYQNDFADTKHLGYICEARPSETVPEKRTCIFPFVYQGKTHSSCIFSANPNVPDETPWCATKVDPITKEMTNSGACQDERLIIYDGGAQGWPCSFPFLFNGRFYDSCTRDMKNATSNETYKIDRYWCPPEHHVHPTSKLWLGDDSKPETYGFCNDLMRPLIKDCPDGYEMVERICMRLSAVPQTHQVAQEDCKKDGADLAFIPSQPVQAALGQRIVEKKAKWNHFVPIKEFWLGAFPKPNGDWDWISYPKPMRLYENWKSSKQGYGCPEQGCTLPNHGLVMKADGVNDWLAGNKTVERPYVCSAKCPSGYTWVERIQKCILIVEASSSSPKAKTLPEAMEHCNQQHGRLIITNHCDELNIVRQVLIDLEHGLGEEFFIGTFAFNLQSANERRRSKVTEEQISSYGYSVDMQADSGSGLCGSMEPSLSAPDTSVTHYFGLKLDATDLITLHYPFIAKDVLTIKKGYICESDDFWGCPEGYEKLMETCVKLVRTKKKRIDTHKACEALGTHLARPQTAMDLFALHSKIAAIESMGTETPTQVTSRYHLDFSRIMDPNHPAFDPSHSDIGCACQNDIVIPGTTKGSDGNCYMKNTYSNTFEQARQRCMNLGMNLAQYESAEEYTAIWNIFGSNEDLWIGAHNPSLSTCPDATACDANFKWVQDDRNVDCSAAINTQGCQSVSGAQCLTLKKNESGKLMDEPCTSFRQSLCQKPCLSGHNDALPRDCVSIQMAMQGDYPALTRVTCDEESFFVCEREQSLKSDLRAFLAKPVAALPLTRDIGPADIASNLDVQVHNVGFDFDRKPNLLLGSALLGGEAFENSGIDVNLKDLIPGDQITVSMWLRTRDASFPTDPQILVDFRGNASSTPPLNESRLELLNGIPQITLHFPNGTKVTKVSQFGMEPQKWHFLSFSFDSSNGQGFLILDDLVTHFQAPGLVIFDTTVDMALLFGSNPLDPSGLAFKGSISCLQVYEQAFTPPQVHFTKNCSYAAGSYQNQEPLCPSGWTSFNDHCYWVSLTKMSFSEASVNCAGLSEFTQTAHLIWNLDKLHMDHASRLVNESFGIHKFWIGLDDRLQVGSWVAHDAAMSTFDGTYEYWEDPAQINQPTRRCGLNSRRNGGFIVSEDCELIYPFVCQMKTLNHPSSNRCPSGYLPYQSKCISGNTTRLDYDEAQESCAIKGGILLAPKNKVALETAKAFAKVYVKGDIWVGVTAEHVDRTVDRTQNIPLVEQISPDRKWSDGTTFDSAADFDLELDSGADWSGPCVYLKASSDFSSREVLCSKPYAFICEWKDPPCPTGFTRQRGSKNGRMCLKLSGGDGPNSKEMCASSDDLFRRPTFPTTHEEALFFKDNMGTGSVWLGMEQGPMSNWHVASDVQKYNDPYPVVSNESLIDLRRFGSWQENLVGTNDASKGCLSFANNGIIQPEFGATCDEARPPACEYRSCLTKRGLSCVFPFKYFNVTEDGTKSEITYHYCASLDIFSPWCATVVSATGEVIEWDECVSDCPQEPPEVVCEMDPPTPTIVSVLGVTTNFSTTHEFGADTVVSELDFVEYHCPEGYYFNGTNRLTVRAFCKNWQWEVDFDPETVCIPVLCTCPQWFPPNSKLGTYNWNNGLPPPAVCNQTEPNVKHLTEVTYNCPDGFMFNTSESDVAIPESATLTFTCSKFANWSPVFQPHCIPRNCVNDPPLINRTARDWMDWDLNIRNRSYTHSINYTCPLKNWGYPSSGENRMVATCQENLRWNLTSVEKCVALPCPSGPPSAPIGGRRWYGLQQTKYSCPPGYKFVDGSYPFFHANCSAAKQWQPPNFLPQCVPRQCSNNPPLHFLGQDLDWSFRSKTLGTKVTYTCPFFKVTQQAGLSVQHSQCMYDKDTDELHWYPPTIQDCTRSLPTSNSGIIVLPAIPNYDVGYGQTTKYHFPLLTERNTTGYSSKNVTTKIAVGPFGFEEAIHIGNKQCVIKSNYAMDQDQCVRNPVNCLNGFSLSIWEKVLYGDEVFNVKMMHQKKYILSTGGDFNTGTKKTYPGMAIYHEGIDLIAVVSTGVDVWYLKVTGQLVNETWSNIGIRWSAANFSSNEPFHLRGGLEMFVNAKRVGQALHPMTRPGADMTLGNLGKWTIAPALESLTTFDKTGDSMAQNGPFFMVGCHRNSEDDTFRDFGMAGSVYDELAFWGRKLITNQTLDEALYFTGGFVPDYDGISDEEWLSILDHVRLDVPEQLEAAGEITYRLYGSRSKEMSYDQLLNFIKDNEEEKMDSLRNTTNATTSFQYDKTEFVRNPAEQISYDRQRLASMTVEKLLLSRGEPFVRPKDLRRVFKVVGPASFPIIPTRENVEGWKSVQMDPSEEGASKVVKEIMEYTRDLLRTANINYAEDFSPMFSAAREEMVIHAQSDGIMLSAMKFDPNQFQRTGTFHETHSFYANHPTNPHQGWEKYPDQIEFPTRFHFKNSSRCAHLPITFVQAIFDGYGAMAPLRRNPANIYSKQIKLDSKGVSIALGVGPDPQDVTKVIDCQIDTDRMKYNPIKIKFVHYDTKTSQRKLLWTQDLDSNIEQRKCAYFNPNFGPFGGWDASGCTTIITEQTSTMCECSTFGTFAVVAEIVEHPSVPDHEVWVKVIKYCGFFFSIVCLVPLMVVIGLSPLLHDMFHLLRFHSALNCFISFVVMLIAQLDSICEERTSNILLSGLQQYFFMATTLFLAFEAFATFRATTMGIIGGYTSTYVFFSYGLPFINIGLTMFLYGDDYGKDPRCFIGWDNSTKLVFFYQILLIVSVALVLCAIVVVNLTTPQTRRESIIDQLASQGRGMAIAVFIWTITWFFGYPTYIRYPDHELPDFYPIFIMLFSWFGVVMFIFMGLMSTRFRAVVWKLVWPQQGWKYASKNEETETELSEMSKSPSMAALSDLEEEGEEEEEEELQGVDLEKGPEEEEEEEEEDKDDRKTDLDEISEANPDLEDGEV